MHREKGTIKPASRVLAVDSLIKVFAEFSDAQKSACACLLIVFESSFYLTWLIFVYFFDAAHHYVNLDQAALLLSVVVVMLGALFGLYKRFLSLEGQPKKLFQLQCVLMMVYSSAEFIIGILFGLFSLLNGVSIASGLMIALFFIHRKIVYFAFVMNLVLAFGMLLIFGKEQLFNASIYATADVQHSLFWIFSYFYLSIVKIIAVVVFGDVAVRGARERLQTVRYMSERDGLTGLYNRRNLHTRMSELLASEGNASLLLLDIDHFKRINDTHGHILGDQVIIAVANYLQSVFKQGGVLGRFGGEEYVVFLPGTSLSSAQEKADELLNGVRHLQVLDRNDQPIPVAVSIGIARTSIEFPPSSSRLSWQFGLKSGSEEYETLMGGVIDRLIDEADQALYAAKNEGRNQVKVFS